jgi:tetratricopeptide (TPR) repeat protein
MAFGADDVGAWLVAVLGDAGRRRVTELVLGSEQERALARAARVAVQAMAREACDGDEGRAGDLARVVGEVFAAAVPGAALVRRATLLESLELGIAAQLAVLDDAELTGAGVSSAAVLGVGGGELAGLLAGHLLAEIVAAGARGGPLFPLAAQLNDDVTHLQGQQVHAALRQLADAVARIAGAQAPAVAAAAAMVDQLPAATPGFTGRDGELGVLAGLLDPAGQTGTVVVSAVAGLAGVGKTTLAVQAGHAARQAGWYPGGVLFIDLHGYDRPVAPAQALDALLRALGITGEDIPTGMEERAGLYRSALAQNTGAVLVIADNASSEAQVRPLLPGGGPHQVLVTSRHTLAGLGARLVDITVLDDHSAVGLLDAALRAARPGDDRVSADPASAGRLAGACGGLPLALQITASILKADPALTTADLAEDLAAESGRLDRLAYDDGAGPFAPSVAAAFALSYQRLGDDCARLFRFLPVNPGPDVSTAAAAALAGLPESRARVLLGSLARAHLAEATPDSATRWRMHDLLRLYARQLSDQHEETDGREDALDRLLGYYLDAAAAADAHLRALPRTPVPDRFAGRAEALAWLDAERPSLSAAVTVAAITGRDRVAMRLPVHLAEYFEWRRRFDDELAVATVGRDAARRLGDRAGEATAVISLGNSLLDLRRFDEAITSYRDAIAIYRETGDRRREAMALGSLGLALHQARRFEEAITPCQDAVAILREIGDRHREAMALGNLGLALREARRFEEATAACRDAVAIFRETGDRHREGMALGNLGLALRRLRRFDEAITAHQEDLAICRETGDRHGEGMALEGLGLALAELERFEEAITSYRDAIAIYRETGDRHGEGVALNNIGLALRGALRFDEAIAAHQDAAAIYRETGDHDGEGEALGRVDRIRSVQQV